MSVSTPAKNESWNWQTMYKIPADILDDLCSRFIVNVPEEERKDLVRLCFQIELAHWFYIDFYCSEEGCTRKHCSFKEFAANIFKHLSFLKSHLPTFENILEQFREYKQAVPTFGAVLLNEMMTHVLLVQGFWSKNSWGFPKGKVNEGEDPARCAVREVLEETGYDISSIISSREFLETTVNDQLTRLYVIPGVPHDSKFVPRTRNEIRAVQWFPLADLPSTKKDAMTKTRLGFGSASFFMVLPFVRLIRNWVACRALKQQQQQPQQTSNRKKQRRKSLEQIIVPVVSSAHRLGKASSEEDNLLSHQLTKSASAAARVGAQTICATAPAKNPSRRQLFADKTEPKNRTRSAQVATNGSKSKATTPSAMPLSTTTKSASPAASFCAPSWLNFRLNVEPILACFD